MTADPFELLCGYEDRGWALVPVLAGSKRAVLRNWPKSTVRAGRLRQWRECRDNAWAAIRRLGRRGP